jgi:predicted SnoaL-like aldol condensation-catalyzing enzyme
MVKASIPWNCKQVHKMVVNDSLVFDNAIQRGYVWDKNRQSLLIDSILRGYPTPPFYTVKDGRTVATPKGNVAVFDALDGKQRCTTITRFKNNEFALCGLEKPIIDDEGNEIDLNGLTYDDLPDSLRDDFDSYSLTVYYFTDATNEEIVEIMTRLNNGKPLTAAENTRIKAADLIGIHKLASHSFLINNLSDKAVDGYQNEDIVVKIYALLNGIESLDNKDIRPIYESLVVTPEVSDTINSILSKLEEIHAKMIENGDKKQARKLVTRTHLITVAPTVRRMIADNKDLNSMVRFFTNFFDGSPSYDEDYNTACSNGSNHAVNVKIRISALEKEYDWFYNAANCNDEDENEDEETDTND